MNQPSEQTYEAAAKRLRRKLEIIRLDLKNGGNSKHHDINECLSLLDIMERTKDRG